MSKLFSPKLNILSTWNSTVGQAFQLFRRTKFVVENTFKWGDWNPRVYHPDGELVDTISVRDARYFKIGHMFWFRVYILCTPRGLTTNGIAVSLPEGVTTKKPNTPSPTLLVSQSFSAHVGATVGGQAPGLGLSYAGTDYLVFSLPLLVDFTAGTALTLRANGFLEVE